MQKLHLMQQLQLMQKCIFFSNRTKRTNIATLPTLTQHFVDATAGVEYEVIQK